MTTTDILRIYRITSAILFGVHISFREFARLGVPVTLAALGGLLVWVALAS